MTQLLQFLSQNRAKEQIENSLEKWKRDQLGVNGKYDLAAEDITLLNDVQGRAFRKFILLFTKDTTVIPALLEELNSFLFGSITAATNACIDLLKKRIAKREEELLKAQEIAHIGNFELNLNTRKAQCSPEIYRIYEIEKGLDFDAFSEFIHPDDRRRVQRCMEQTIRTGAYEIEFRYLKNGILNPMR